MSMTRESEINKYDHLLYMHKTNNDVNNITAKQDSEMLLSNFLPEPNSLSQVLRLTESIKNKWGTTIHKKIKGLFDSDTVELSERPLPNDEIVPVKLVLKTKLNCHGGFDKLKAQVCLRGEMQEREKIVMYDHPHHHNGKHNLCLS